LGRVEVYFITLPYPVLGRVEIHFITLPYPVLCIPVIFENVKIVYNQCLLSVTHLIEFLLQTLMSQKKVSEKSQ
ncbi:MAG: hypothetical protein KAI22_01470, partial [Gammaproteobacteria bacterium]|nr:hypothetical protein [Gammaproteobacteria bacterium]